MKTCCCCGFDLRTGTLICAWYTMLRSLLSVASLIYESSKPQTTVTNQDLRDLKELSNLMNQMNQLQSSTITWNDQSLNNMGLNNNENDNWSPVNENAATGLKVRVGFEAIVIAFSICALVGVNKKSTGLLIPWIVIMCLEIGLVLLGTLAFAVIGMWFLSFNTVALIIVIVVLVILLAFIGLDIYCVQCVNDYRKRLLEENSSGAVLVPAGQPLIISVPANSQYVPMQVQSGGHNDPNQYAPSAPPAYGEKHYV